MFLGRLTFLALLMVSTPGCGYLAYVTLDAVEEALEPPPPRDLISNGGFEEALAGTWSVSGSPLPTQSSDQVLNGSFSLLLPGGSSTGACESTFTFCASQTVSIPSDATKATLEFHYWTGNGGALVLDQSASEILEVIDLENASGEWRRSKTDLSSWLPSNSGQSTEPATIYFGVGPSGSMFVDDVSLVVE